MRYLNALTVICTFVLAIAACPATLWGQSNNDVLRAVQNSDYERLTDLLIEGADVDQTAHRGFTPLMAASRIGDRKIVGVLLSHNPDINRQNQAGATALMVAAKYGHLHVVEQLLEHGADPLIKNNSGLRAARFAYAYNHLGVFRILERAERDREKS